MEHINYHITGQHTNITYLEIHKYYHKGTGPRSTLMICWLAGRKKHFSDPWNPCLETD